MSISTPFIERPVATTLLLVAVTLAGAISYTMLPVAALPQVDFPTIQVFANLPGASPEVMAAAVATPLEKQFTRIAGITEMTSRSTVGSAQVTLQFDNGSAAFDHVLLATGYHIDISKLGILAPRLLRRIRCATALPCCRRDSNRPCVACTSSDQVQSKAMVR